MPAEFLSDVLTDLSSRRGRVIGTDESADGEVVIVSRVPEVELARYDLDLWRLTGRRGRASSEAPKTVSAK